MAKFSSPTFRPALSPGAGDVSEVWATLRRTKFKFGYRMTTQTFNITYYVKAGQIINGQKDDRITRCSRWTFQSEGHKNFNLYHILRHTEEQYLSCMILVTSTMVPSHGLWVFTADFLKFPPHISDIQQVLSDQRMKCTATSCRTECFFIGKSDSFQELCTKF